MVLLTALTATTMSKSKAARGCEGPRLPQWHCNCHPMQPALDMLTCGINDAGVLDGPASPCDSAVLAPPSPGMRVARSGSCFAFAR